MSELEAELKKVLRREEPPADFTARVLHRVDERAARHWWTTLWTYPAWRLAWCSLLLVVLVSSAWNRHHAQIEKGREAKRQLFIALRIASAELRNTQARMTRVQNDMSEGQ